MTRVYLLSSYGEYGAKEVHATTDPERLHGILNSMRPNWPEGEKAKMRLQLQTLLNQGRLHPDGEDLTYGWGGIQLHVVELQ